MHIKIFPNLMAEMARLNVSEEDVGRAIGKDKRTVHNKLIGATKLTLNEAIAIGKLFPGCSLDYLFGDQIEPGKA